MFSEMYNLESYCIEKEILKWKKVYVIYLNLESNRIKNNKKKTASPNVFSEFLNINIKDFVALINLLNNEFGDTVNFYKLWFKEKSIAINFCKKLLLPIIRRRHIS